MQFDSLTEYPPVLLTAGARSVEGVWPDLLLRSGSQPRAGGVRAPDQVTSLGAAPGSGAVNRGAPGHTMSQCHNVTMSQCHVTRCHVARQQTRPALNNKNVKTIDLANLIQKWKDGIN